MNTKYPLTPEGVERKQRQLFELPDEELREVALEVSRDLRTWVFSNFEVTEEQRAYYEKMPVDYNLIMGCQSASSIINRDYVIFGDVPSSYTAEQKRKRTTKTEVSAEVSYSESDGWGGNVGVTISF